MTTAQAALVVSIVSALFTGGSLAFQAWSFRLQGKRAELTPVMGIHDGGGAVTADADFDGRPTLRQVEAQLPGGGQWFVGVRVVNTGRAALHVTGWALRAEPSGAVYHPGLAPASPKTPCNIPPGGAETFFTPLETVRAIASGLQSQGRGTPRLTVEVTSGNRTWKSKPIYGPLITDAGQ